MRAKENPKGGKVSMQSIVDFLTVYSQEKPNDIAFTYIEDNGEKRQITFRELQAAARSIAGCLKEKIKPGDAVVLLFPQGLEYIQAFIGCLFAGAVAVPLYPPTSRNHAERVFAVIRDCDARLALSSDEYNPALSEDLAPLPVLGFAELSEGSSSETSQSAPTPRQLAFLQYTSGSTGSPKGVMVSHGNILANLKSLQEATGCSTEDVFCNWLPLFHDLGLINTVLLPVYLGSHSIIMSPARFIKRPLAWFEAISENKATICGAPNFAFDHCIDRIRESGKNGIDLSSWRVAFNAAEPVDVKTIQKFSERFASMGFREASFYPSYGMAEATVFISGGNPLSPVSRQSFGADGLKVGQVGVDLESHNKRTLVGCGKTQSGHYIKIVDPESCREVSGNQVGEIWFSGPSVAQGYWNDEDKTKASFGATLPGDDRKYLRTGDLGFIYQGELFISGRIKDVLIIKGRNYYPQDIEKIAYDSSKGLVQGGAAAFEVDGKAVLIQEVTARAKKQFDYSTACKNIQSAVYELFEILLDDIVFVRARKISKTSSGKIQRSLTKKQYLSGDINALYSLKQDAARSDRQYEAPATLLEEQICKLWQEALGIDSVGVTDNFFKLGGHSLYATRLIARINAELNCHISIKDLFYSPTIRELAGVVEVAGVDAPKTIVKAPEGHKRPLSFAQQRLWLLDQIEGGSAHYNLSGFLKLTGRLNHDALNRAFSSILERHESLRTCITVRENGQPVQIIQSPASFAIQVVDLSALQEGERQQQLDKLMATESGSLFDLSRDLMLRAQLVKLAAGEYILLVTTHHIASDGWSMSILINEFGALYNAYAGGGENPLSPLPIQYTDYAFWQRNCLQGELLDQQLEYWEHQLTGLPVVHGLPLDHARPAEQSFAGDTYRSHVDAAISRALSQFCQRHGATVFMGLHAVFSVLLARYSNETDIVVGSPIANREQKEVANLIGFFVNTLVLRSNLSGNPTFVELLQRSKDLLLNAYAHQQVPFEQVVERLQPERNQSHSPLFQVMLILQNNEEGIPELPGLKVSPVERTLAHFAKYDLTLNVKEDARGLSLGWEYNTDLFEPRSIARMAMQFNVLLQALLAEPEISVFKAGILTEQERHQLLTEWNATAVDYPRDKCIHLLFETQVENNPDAVAVTVEDKQLSYNELNQHANRLAHYLINEKQVGPDSLVGICVDRSLDTIVGILAILKAGGAYVPLDPEYPEARLAYMLEDAKLTTVLTQSHLFEKTPVSDSLAVCLDDESLQRELQKQSDQNPDVKSFGLTPNNLAYVIYTSGSTGNPKGVMVEHGNVVNFLIGMQQKPGIKTEDCLLAVTSTSFDIHGLELFLPLIAGASLVIAGREATADPEVLKALLKQHRISIMQATPATWKMLLESNWQVELPLKVLCGGEALSLSLARALLEQPKLELWNMYGPTETTIWSTTGRILPRPDQVLMGKPIANTQVYVVSNNMEPAPVGVAGELLIGGAGVTRGYLNRPELTDEKFIANPFYDPNDPASSKRLYRTGDLVRWLPQGSLEFLGRIDHQVKIRGFRIELGEIENVLARHPQIKDAVVVAKDRPSGDRQLHAYVVPKPANESDVEVGETASFSLFYFGADTYLDEDRYNLYLSAAKFADENGFEAIWTPERHFDPVGGLYPSPSVLSAGLAAMTRQVKLRAGSVVLPLHDPLRVAEEWSMVDNLSNGRVGIAIASGWHPRDFVLAPGNFDARKEVVNDGISTLKTLWQGKKIIRKDGKGEDAEVRIYPEPVQKQLPLWITAAGNPETFVEAGRLGAHVLTHLLGQTIDELAKKLVLYRESLLKNGHDPRAGRVTLMVHTYLGEDLQRALDHTRIPFKNYMRSHIALLVPMLKSLGISTDGLSETDLENMADFAFERYARTASFIGTPKSVAPVVARLKDIGVDEFACLIDWMDTASTLQGLDSLRELQLATRSLPPSSRAMMDYCRERLPEYMIPSGFMVMDKLPLTPNGKVDRKALPEPDISVGQNAYLAPRSETEKRLCDIWQEVLGVEQVGITDNFFQLGGHSLLATRLVARINQAFGVAFSVKLLFSSQTVETAARTILQLDKNSALPAPVRVSRDQALPSSFGQQRLWLLAQIDGTSVHYNMPGSLKLKGSLNIDALNKVFTDILERHESLRTRFEVTENGQPIQIIQAATPFVTPLVDLSELNEDARQKQLLQYAEDEARREFDLQRDVMFRARLLKMAADEHILLVTTHHIASDGWSSAILIKEFRALYTAYVQGGKNSLGDLPVQYADYAYWQRQWLQGEVLDQQLSYWENQLADLPLVHSLPLDRPRPATQTFVGRTHVSHLDKNSRGALEKLCESEGATLFMGLQAVFAALLSRYSGETDIVMGSPVANREQEEVAELIGYFANTLIFRSDLSGNPGFIALLRQSRNMLLDAYAHQQVPFEQIVERLQPERSLSHHALFQVMLVLQHNESGMLELPGQDFSLELPGLSLSPTEHRSVGSVKYDLTLNVFDNGKDITLGWEYNSDLFDRATIARMATHFNILLNALLAAPEQKIPDVELLQGQERHQLLVEWNGITADYSRDHCIHELFETQVDRSPDAVAVVYENRQLTYCELNKKANRLAHHLVTEKRVKPDTLVGICVERSLEMIVGILAVLKAGGAYVPLDPDYPQARLKHMLDDASLTTVLTQRHLRDITPLNAAQAIYLDDESLQSVLEGLPDSNPQSRQSGLNSNHLAYVIYTSGSTGTPKGVMVEHSGLVCHIEAARRYFGLTAEDNVLQFSSLSFDVAQEQIFCSLVSGSTLYIRARGLLSPGGFSQYCLANGITVADVPPSYCLEIFNDEKLSQEISAESTLRLLIVGGEELPKNLLKRWQESSAKFDLINAYGPAETVISPCMHRFDRDPDYVAVPIGRPLANRQCYVVSGNNKLQPKSVAGELLIGGACLARGYLNRPDLTAEKFIANPFQDESNPASGERLYKTGDLVRWLPDGNLEFLGRIDQQAKIRGFRIELGEIEYILGTHADVAEAIVLVKGATGSDNAESGNKHLVAYVVTETVDLKSENEDSIAARRELTSSLRHHLSQSVPEYMIPSAFVFLSGWPLSPNGKIDRKALPEADASVQQETYVAPRGETESILCEIWQEVLGVERVGITDNFFRLGGHSLLVMQVISRLQHPRYRDSHYRRKDLSLTARQVFRTPRLMDLAQAIDNPMNAPKTADESVDKSAVRNPETVFKAPPNLIPDGCEKIIPEMLPLVNLTGDEVARIVAKVPGGAGNVQDIYPLAPLQEGILFHHMMNSDGDPYILPSLFKMNGRQAVDDFIAAMQFVVDRHDVFRTAIFWEGLSIPVQVVCRRANVPVNQLELDPALATAGEIETEMKARCTPHRLEINLGQAPLLQLQVAAVPDSEQYFVLLYYHHIISDHVALEIIEQELAVYLAGQAKSLPAPVPYREFVAHAQHQAAQYNAKTFFTEKLGDIEEPTLPFNLLDVAGDGSRIIELKADVPADTSEAIRHLAKKLSISTAAVFHAAWAMVVAGCSGRDDVVFGTVLSGRLQGTIQAENILGVFINTLPLRVKLNGITAIELIRQMQDSLMDILPYEQTPLAVAQNCSGLAGGGPLFSSILNYRHTEIGGNASVRKGQFEFIFAEERTSYPLILSVDDFGEGFALEAQVDESISAERVLAYMQTAVGELVKAAEFAPQQAVQSLSILPEAEQHHLLVELNNTGMDYLKEKCIHELFEAQVEQGPKATAAIFENRQLTYEELNKKANQLAHYLINEKQVTPDTLVGVCMERSLEMLIGILAVLKAGGAYVPLDPEYPRARLQYMLDDAGLKVVLTQKHLGKATPVTDEQAVYLDDVLDRLHGQPEKNPGARTVGLTPGHLAYVIYTSGSTGNPKGVMIEHRNTVAFLCWAVNTFSKEQLNCVLASTSVCFDLSIFEMFAPLAAGGSVLIVENIATLQSWRYPREISLINTVPSAIEALLMGDSIPASVKTVNLAGEPLKQKTVDRLYHAGVNTVFDLYGPSEDTTYSTFVLRTENGSASIGRPIGNTQVYLLDKALQPVGQGIAGEIVIGGAGLARGYLNRADLTDEKFIPNPFRDKTRASGSERLYKTGDLARWLPDGNLEFLGRVDHQVKIRGFRIELGEIEHRLHSHSSVKDAVVVAREAVNSNGKYLVAYVVPKPAAGSIDLQGDEETHELVESLRLYLNEALPNHMVPGAFVLLEQLPLTPNGKVDRNALPEPDTAMQKGEYVAPSTETEKVLCELWQEVLGVDRVGVTDDFFDLGGHSLLVMKLVARLQSDFSVNIPIKTLFNGQNVSALAEIIEKNNVIRKNKHMAVQDLLEETEW